MAIPTTRPSGLSWNTRQPALSWNTQQHSQPTTVSFSTPQNQQDKEGFRPISIADPTLFLFRGKVYRIELTKKMNTEDLQTLRDDHIPTLTSAITILAQENPSIAGATRFHYTGNKLHFAADSDSPTRSTPIDQNTQDDIDPLISFIQERPDQVVLPEPAAQDITYRKLQGIGGIEETLRYEDMQNCWAQFSRKHSYFEVIPRMDETDQEMAQTVVAHIKPHTEEEMQKRLFLLPIRLKDGKLALLFIDFRNEGRITYLTPEGSDLDFNVKVQVDQLIKRLQKSHFSNKKFTFTQQNIKGFDQHLLQLHLTQQVINDPDPTHFQTQLSPTQLQEFRQKLAKEFQSGSTPKTSFLGKLFKK